MKSKVESEPFHSNQLWHALAYAVPWTNKLPVGKDGPHSAHGTLH